MDLVVSSTRAMQNTCLGQQPALHMQSLGSVWLVALVGLKALGYLAFRGANSQKDTFRRDPQHPSVRHLQTLQTERGTRLITSGWWGVARHINYTGDWLMA